MHRHVRRIGDQRAVGGEHRAGEIEPLLDVDRIGGVLQRHAHLLGDRHEQVVEHFQHHRIGIGADRAGASSGTTRVEHEMVLARVISACQPSSTTTVWCGSMMMAGPAHLVARLSCSRGEHAQPRCQCAAGIEARRRAGGGRVRRWSDSTGSGELRAPPIASTETASTTSSFVLSMKPKRDLCAASNADFIACEVGARVRSVPRPARRRSRSPRCASRPSTDWPCGRNAAPAPCRSRHSGYGRAPART